MAFFEDDSRFSMASCRQRFCPVVPGRASQQPAKKALWLFERKRVPQGPPAARSAGQPEGPRDEGGFFWFVFLSAQENEHRPKGVVNSVHSKGTRQSSFLTNTARRGKMLFTELSKKTVEAARKPNSVPADGYPPAGYDHSSLGSGCPLPPATYPGARTGHPQALPYLVLHRVGFTKHSRSPGNLVRSYRTFSPLPAAAGRLPSAAGGMLSVALSFALPRLHVMEHPALRCSDFPPGQSSGPAIVWATSTAHCVTLFPPPGRRLSCGNGGKRSIRRSGAAR